MELNSGDYAKFREYLRMSCGIELGDNKQYLVTSRMRKLLISNKIENFSQLIDKLQAPSSSTLKQEVLDAMTTNETSWFRDRYPYDFLEKQFFPQWQQDNLTKPARIWSAACSTGQEPYSISMIVSEINRLAVPSKRVSANIVATDVSQSVLAAAKNGLFDQFSVMRGLTRDHLGRHFVARENESWQINQALRSSIDFRLLNLQNDFSNLGQFDLIFCRNVLIYFSAELKKDILCRIRRLLQPGGLLFLGSSESITGAEEFFELMSCHPGLAFRAR